MNTHRPCRNQIHTLKQSHAPTHSDLHTRTHSHARTNAQTYTHTRTHAGTRARAHTHTHIHTHTHTQARVCERTHTPTHALPHMHASRHLPTHEATNTHTPVRVCAQAPARAHTHTHIQAQHADESARGEIELLLARTLRTERNARAHEHISKHTRTRTAGRAATARHPRHRCVYSHARARGVCACTHSVLDTQTSAPPHVHVLTHTQPHPRARRQVRCAPPPDATVKRRAAAEKIRTSRSAPT